MNLQAKNGFCIWKSISLNCSPMATSSLTLFYFSGNFVKEVGDCSLRLARCCEYDVSLLCLSYLHLSSCSLSSIPISLSVVNFTSLATLDLLDNSLNSTTLPNWLWNLSSLTYLDLEASLFHGPLPCALGNLTSLNVELLDRVLTVKFDRFVR